MAFAVDSISENKCGTILSEPSNTPKKSLVQGIQSYARDVRDTHGRRLFLKESPESGPTQFGGVLSAKKADLPVRLGLTRMLAWPGDTVARLTGFPEYTFTPFSAIYDWTYVRPIEWITIRSALKQKMRLSRLVEIPLALVMSASMTQPIVTRLYNEGFVDKLEAQVQIDQTSFRNIEQYDFRYKELNGLSRSDQKAVALYTLQQARENYFNYLAQGKDNVSDLAWNEALLQHPYFIHLKKMIEDGISPMDGYKVPPERIGALNNSQKISLLEINHQLQMNLEGLSEFYDPRTDSFTPDLTTPLKNEVWQDVMASSFSRQLLRLHQERLLSSGQLLYRLQEDQVWMAKFKEWKVLGIERQAVDEHGRFTEVALTMDDIRRETLRDILSRKQP